MKLRGKGLTNSKIGKWLFLNIYLNLRKSYVDYDFGRIYVNNKCIDGVSLGILNKDYETEQTEIVKEIIKKEDIVVDIGAHVGYYTILLSSLVGNNGCVYSYEPTHVNFRRLILNKEYNHSKNVILNNYAIGKEKGVFKFYTHDNTTGGSLNIEKHPEYTDSEYLKVVKLDDEIKGRVDFIKIDTDGNEMDVLEGAKRIIKENPNIKIMVEWFDFSESDKNKLKETFDVKEISNEHDAILTKKDAKEQSNEQGGGK